MRGKEPTFNVVTADGVDSVLGDDTPPTVSIENPADLALITLPTDIIGSEILMSDRHGRSEKIYSDKQERAATVWTTFDLVVPNPPVITGSLFLRVTMQYAERQAPDYENKPKGDRVFIGTIGAVIGD